MPLEADAQLGPYRIVSPLGAGGMGEVYRARDTRLDRDVAIKVLPADRAADPEARERFAREARAIASLHHPNICALYDVHLPARSETASFAYLVMELLDGETLQQRLRRGPFEVAALVDAAIALTDGLDAAHARGVIHRDLKPANVFLTSHGQVKVVDFGLAKPITGPDASTRERPDPQLTSPGETVGTVAYMSPEQVRGEPLDARTDLFSLGAVLYEMATGRRPFTGSTTGVVASEILRSDPPSARVVRADLPPRLDEILLKALEKDRDTRYQSAAELRADLKRVKRDLTAGGSSSSASKVTTSPGRRRLALVVGAVAILAAGAFGLWQFPRGGTGPVFNPRVQRLTVTGDAWLPAISPDGKYVAYSRDHRSLWIRHIPSQSDVQLVAPMTGRKYASLSITPDGNFVDFVVAAAAAPSEVWRVPLLGGTPRRLLSNVWSATGWSHDGSRFAFVRLIEESGATAVIVADYDGRNERVLATRRPPEAFVADDGNGYVEPSSNRPSWSADDRTLILAGAWTGQGSSASAVITGSILIDAETGETVRTTPVSGGILGEVAFVGDDRQLLMQHGRPYLTDLTAGQAVPLVQDFGGYFGLSLSADRAVFASARTESRGGIWTSDTANLTFTLAVPETPAAPRSATFDNSGALFYAAFMPDRVLAIYRHDPSGTTAMVIDHVDLPGFFAVNPRGDAVIFTHALSPSDLMRVNIDGSGRTRLVSNTGAPGMMPDGRTILFGPIGPGLASIPIDGGTITRLSDRDVYSAPDISHDGKRVMFLSTRRGSILICDLPSCTNAKEVPLDVTMFHWTPDDRGIAYVDPVDATNIWVRPLDGGPRRQLTHFADREIRDFSWSYDGKRLAVTRGTMSSDIVLITGFK